METGIYQVEFNNGRIFRIFCANKKQKERFRAASKAVEHLIKETTTITNGIHNVSQWERMTAVENLVLLSSVGTWLNKETLDTYPNGADGMPDFYEGTMVPFSEINGEDDWFQSLSMADLKTLAKTIYFSDVKREDSRAAFVERLETYTVIDKRNLGFYCCQCATFGKKTAFASLNKICHPRGHEQSKEIWIVNDHYDGCQGWN